MKTNKLIGMLAASVMALSLCACGGGGGGGGGESSNDSSTSAPDYSYDSEDSSNNSNNSSNSTPKPPAYTGWAPKDLKGYTIRFNKKIHEQDTYRFDSSNSAASNTGNICIVTGIQWVDDKTIKIEEFFVSRRRYGTDEQDPLSAFEFNNITLHFTSAGGGTVAGAGTVSYSGGGFLAGTGINSFTISK